MPFLHQAMDVVKLRKEKRLTPSRAKEAVDVCQKTEACSAQAICITDTPISAIIRVFCEAFDFYLNDFAECEEKISKDESTCLKSLPLTAYAAITSKNEAKVCKTLTRTITCAKKDLTRICGAEYWTNSKKFLEQFINVSGLKCEVTY